MRRKVNKKRVALIIIVMIVLITMPTFGRYVYNNVRDMYLKSRNFSFSSNLLTVSGKSYRYANWSGIENYEVDFQLYSYENELSLFTYGGAGLGYTLTCSVDDPDKASVHIDYTSGESTGSSYIPNETNVRNVKIYLKPLGSLSAGDVVTLTVIAKTTEPYKKTLKADFKIKITDELISYKIEDEEESVYATLKLLNTKSTAEKIKLTFDPKLLMIDTSDDSYINQVSQTTKTVDGVEYVNSVTITLEAETSKNIKFYKRNKSIDYTYPGGTYGSMVISVITVE